MKEEVNNVPWLKKEKVTGVIKEKYKDEKCSICLEVISGDITITKCNHIFHYECLSQYINNSGKTDCPICRSDLKTGRKKEINYRNNLTQQNNRNINNNNLHNSDNFSYNIQNINNRDNDFDIDFDYVRFSEQSNENNYKGVLIFIRIFVLIFILKFFGII